MYGLLTFLLPWILNFSLGSSQSGNWYTVWRTGNIVESDIMAEFHRGWFSTMLATDTDFEVSTGRTAFLHTNLDQLAYTLLIQYLEGVLFQYSFIQVMRQEFTFCVITAESKGGLGQVIGTKGEELGFLGNLISSQGSSW